MMRVVVLSLLAGMSGGIAEAATTEWMRPDVEETRPGIDLAGLLESCDGLDVELDDPAAG